MSMATLRRRRVVLAGSGGDAGGGEDPGEGGPTPFFEDHFAGGTTNPYGGFEYSNPSTGGLEFCTVVAAGDPGAEVMPGFTHSLRTRYLAQAIGQQDGNGQINFSLGREIDEVGLDWQLHVPANYNHRNNYDPGPPVVPMTDNNKFWHFWGGAYSSGYVQPALELNNNGVTLDNASDGKSYTLPKMRFSTGPSAGTYTDIPGGGTLLIGPDGLIVPGQWSNIKVYCKKESSLGAGDGVWKMKANGTLVHDFTGLYLGAADPVKALVGMAYGYLLGAANSGFTEQTDFHTQWLKFYDTNPGI